MHSYSCAQFVVYLHCSTCVNSNIFHSISSYFFFFVFSFKFGAKLNFFFIFIVNVARKSILYPIIGCCWRVWLWLYTVAWLTQILIRYFFCCYWFICSFLLYLVSCAKFICYKITTQMTVRDFERTF